MTAPFHRATTARRRRTALGTVLGLVLVPALAACGGDADADASTGPELLPAAEGTTQYPLTLDTAWGEVTIEERPERIVSADSYEFGLLVALGVTPVATHDVDLDQVPWSADVLVEQPETWEWGGEPVPAETVASVDADLVVATAWGPEPLENVEQLGQVAPVLGQREADAVGVSWQDQVTLLGEVLDLQERAATLVEDYDAFFADFRAEHPEFSGRTVAYLEQWEVGDTWYSNPTGSTFARVLGELGFAEHQVDDQLVSSDTGVSDELLSAIDADVLVVMDYSGNSAAFDEWIASPAFQQVPAARAGHLVTVASPDRDALLIDGEVVAHLGFPMAYSDPIGTPRLAEALAPALSDALAG